jgi:hypothetical protein
MVDIKESLSKKLRVALEDAGKRPGRAKLDKINKNKSKGLTAAGNRLSVAKKTLNSRAAKVLRIKHRGAFKKATKSAQRTKKKRY